MNKKQLIENLRIDAEWWLMDGENTPNVSTWEFNKFRNDSGLYCGTDGQYLGSVMDQDCEIWFNLLIAEALEKE